MSKRTIFPGFGGSQSKMQSAPRAKRGGEPGKSLGLKVGKPARGVSSQETARIGTQVVTSRVPEKAPGPISVALGNQLTKGTAGPGVGRTVCPTGSQGRHGGGEGSK